MKASVITILICISSIAQSQEQAQASRDGWSVSTIPLLDFPIGQLNISLERKETENLGVEIGGDYFIHRSWADEGKGYKGYSLRIGLRYYLPKKEGRIFFLPYFFYRKLNFYNNYYINNGNVFIKPLYFLLALEDKIYYGNEELEVYCIGLHAGGKNYEWGTAHKEPIISKHLFWGWYAGISLRQKRHHFIITQSGEMGQPVMHWLPQPIHSYYTESLPSLHAGLSMGVSFGR